jgi:hypothetical protein
MPISRAEPRGFQPSDKVLRWRDCPDCGGRGWFLINPFATGGGDGVGGLDNMRQCATCKAAYERHLARETKGGEE